jgi:hypothetical protein
MKANLNRSFFLNQALPIIDLDHMSIAAYGGVLSVASFGNAVNFRVPACVIEPGQAYLSADDWREVVQKVQDSKDIMVDIVL